MRAPQREPASDLPGRVTIYEVGPRDGLQNEKAVVPAGVKAEFIRRLATAGLDTIETTSFVPPSWVPQLADASEVLDRLGDDGRGAGRPVLVPNERGLDRALEAGVGAVAIFGSATETFARKNLNRTVAESVEMFAPVVQRAKDAGLWVRAYVSMCFGDPWEEVPIGQVVDVSQRLMHLGCDQLSLGDTIGVGTTGHVSRLLDALEAGGIGAERVGVHFHDTYGQALANTMTALRHGVTVVDASTGGLRLPLRESATGNLATEDLVWALDGAGVQTQRRPPVTRRDQCLDGRAPRPPGLRRASCGRLPGRAGLGDRRSSRGGSTGSATFDRRCRAPGHPRRDRGRTTFAARRRCRRVADPDPLAIGSGLSEQGERRRRVLGAGQDRDGAPPLVCRGVLSRAQCGDERGRGVVVDAVTAGADVERRGGVRWCPP